jgi:hypothetical protein
MTSDADMFVLNNKLWTPELASAAAAGEFEAVNAHYFGFKPPRISDADPWGSQQLGFQMCFIYARVWQRLLLNSHLQTSVRTDLQSCVSH